MNSYYYAFVPGFNWWYIVSVVFVALMVFIGAAMYQMDDDLKIYRYNRKILTVTSVFFAVIIFVMISCESGLGIIQYFDNGLGPYESPFYSLVAAAMAIVFLAVLYAAILKAVGTIAAWAKHGYLVEKRAEMRKQEQKENPRA